MEAYVNGVSRPARSTGSSSSSGSRGMTKDRVSAICRGLDEHVAAVPRSGRWRAPTRTCGWTRNTSRSATTGASCPRRWWSPTRCMRRGSGRCIGLDVGEVESGSFWVEFLRSLKKSRAAWRPPRRHRCSTKDSRQRSPAVLGLSLAALHRPLRPGHGSCTAAATNAASSPPRSREIFNAENRAQATRARDPRASAVSSRSRRRSAELLEEAEEDLIAFYAFPREHWTKLRSHEPARARQQRDRPPLRRRRHLP